MKGNLQACGLHIASLLLFLSVPHLLADETVDEGDSQKGDIHYAVVKVSDSSYKVLLSLVDHPEQSVELFTTEVPLFAKCLSISPDEKWIVVTEGGGSFGLVAHLFKRGNGLHYTENKDADIDDKAEILAWKQSNLTPARSLSNHQSKLAAGEYLLDHRYVTVLSWAPNSQSMLVHLDGHEGRTHIVGWLGIYDVISGEFSYDLAKMNNQMIFINNPR